MGILDPKPLTPAAAAATYLDKAKGGRNLASKRAVVPAIGQATPLVQVLDGRLGDASDGDGLYGTPGTYSITTDKFFDQFRVGSGVTIEIARGARIFARIIVNDGTIRAAKTDGANATNATGALGGGAPTLGSGSTQLIGASGGNTGGNGTTTNGAAGVA